MAVGVPFAMLWILAPILAATNISEVSYQVQDYTCGMVFYTVWCPSDIRTFCSNSTRITNETICVWPYEAMKFTLGECCENQPLDNETSIKNFTVRCDYYLAVSTDVGGEQLFSDLSNCSWVVPGSLNNVNTSSSCSNLTSSNQGLNCSLLRHNSSTINDPDRNDNFRKSHPLFVFLMVLNLTVSLAGIAIHFAVFIVVPSMRNLPGKMLTSLCFALNGAYISFIVIRLGNGNCKVTSGIMHYCFLASFFWMNAMAFDICWTFWKATNKMRVATGSQWRRFAIYSAYSWLTPIPFVVAPALVFDAPGEMDYYTRSNLSLREGVLICSIGNNKSLLLCVVIPVTAIMFINVALSILSATTIIRNAHSGGSLRGSHSSSVRYNMKLCFRLSLFVGLTWIIGIFAHFYNVRALQYIFSLLNSLQGFFLFLAFTCTKKVYRYIFDKVFHIKNLKQDVPLNSSLVTE